VVPSCLVRQIGLPVDEFVPWEFRNSTLTLTLDRRDLLLINCTADRFGRITVDEHSMLSHSVCCVELRCNRSPALTLCCVVFVEQVGCSLVAFLLVLSIVRLLGIDESIGLIQHNVGKASNTKCHNESMSSSSCLVSS